MIFERTMAHFNYTPYSIYFMMVLDVYVYTHMRYNMIHNM